MTRDGNCSNDENKEKLLPVIIHEWTHCFTGKRRVLTLLKVRNVFLFSTSLPLSAFVVIPDFKREAKCCFHKILTFKDLSM